MHGDGQRSRDGGVSCLVSGHVLVTRGSVHGSIVGVSIVEDCVLGWRRNENDV